ncbi:hypothetical protein LIER_42612 [Lithospermum erythrorhizon]|uniref:Uncharacterized protein n=1 Tax=Lithospermum erythrorhizon TaxID=34254 RepID=A0AAV3NN74_LITER
MWRNSGRLEVCWLMPLSWKNRRKNHVLEEFRVAKNKAGKLDFEGGFRREECACSRVERGEGEECFVVLKKRFTNDVLLITYKFHS